MPTPQMISFSHEAGTLDAYLARPQTEGIYPGVVVIHEIYGLNDDIKAIAERFAGEGYVALAVDLFGDQSRAVCMFRMFSGMMFNSLEHNGVRSLKSALNYLEKQPFVDKDRIGAIGFCLGGNLSICWACTDPRLKVIAPFYGMNPRPLEAVARACPVVGSYPGQDFTANAGRRLDETLNHYQIEHDIKVYPDAKHSFFNHGRNHHESSAADAWTRTLSFFDHHLKTFGQDRT